MPNSNLYSLPEGLLLYLEFLLAGFCVFGFVGVALYSDEFDALRVSLTAFVGIPILFFYFLFHYVYPNWPTDFRPLRLSIPVILMLAFSWGNLMLLNAASEKQNSVVVRRDVGGNIVSMQAKKGNFGWVYTTRF